MSKYHTMNAGWSHGGKVFKMIGEGIDRKLNKMLTQMFLCASQ
jgi:hypothetical protein